MSPTEGLPLVLSVTVPVRVAASAMEPERSRLKEMVIRSFCESFMLIKESSGYVLVGLMKGKRPALQA